MRPLPPFRSIEAFVVAARTSSFAAAAAALGLSLPALSRRIGILEDALQRRLFRRLPRGVELLPAGRAYLDEIGPALDIIRRSTEALRDRSRRSAVRVSLISTLAANWLVPRLTRFHQAHPRIDVELETTADCIDLEQRDTDFAIRLGLGPWPGLRCECLIALDIYPVCSPSLAIRARDPHALASHTLLGPSHRPEFWPEWLQAASSDPAVAGPRPARTFDNLQLLHEAAASGMGVAIALDPLVRPYLADRRLVRPFAARVRSARGFHLLSRDGGRLSKPAQAFRRWLLAEARGAADAAAVAVS